LQTPDDPLSDGTFGDRHLKNGKDPPFVGPTNVAVDANNIQPIGINGVSLSFKPKCQFSIKQAEISIERAKTTACKQEIADVVCTYLAGNLYPDSLPNTCPIKGILKSIAFDTIFTNKTFRSFKFSELMNK